MPQGSALSVVAAAFAQLGVKAKITLRRISPGEDGKVVETVQDRDNLLLGDYLTVKFENQAP